MRSQQNRIELVSTRPGANGVGVELLQAEDFGSTQHAPEGEPFLRHCLLDSFDKACPADDDVATRERLHRRLVGRADDALEKEGG